ncbi:membrane protein YqaA with SNARE-associated domain [Inhella inkyongensis]|uniref:Membrane protein YqaA with SNARE-associated domain n=1 Tax=Inhella inkyongensis TaxID=392593 RepID=A0A840S3Y5_9BURK|nr:YqaA family protein [Inhella inkyongensis]MBB5203361.1 membrane protein YqaA with SNARE-associated domain [Inhella inkyongensis]
MESWLLTQLTALLAWLALPAVGLPAVFLVALISATLLPMGSEPAVFALIKSDMSLFWPAILVATVGNTLGGGISWGMGWAAERGYESWRQHAPANPRLLQLMQRFGAKTCVLSWLPLVGDPLCAVAGWLRLPFWPCLAYMAVGKFLRYLLMTSALLWLWPGEFAPS